MPSAHPELRAPSPEVPGAQGRPGLGGHLSHRRAWFAGACVWVLEGTMCRAGSWVLRSLTSCTRAGPLGHSALGSPEKLSFRQASTRARWLSAQPPSLPEQIPAPLTRSPAQAVCLPAWGPVAPPRSTRPCCRSPAALAQPRPPTRSAPAPAWAAPPRVRSLTPTKGTFLPRPASRTPRAKPSGGSSSPSRPAGAAPSSRLPASPALCLQAAVGTAARATGRTAASGAEGSGRQRGPPA